MIVIVGESGAGKTTLQNELSEVLSDKFRKLVTYTTRPKRDIEIDGEDYNFVSEEEFDRLTNEKFFLETATYRGWHYGCPKYATRDKDPIKDNDVAVLTPAGLRAAKRLGMNVVSIYLKVDRRARLIKLLKRGDDIEEAYRRSLSDVGQFDGIENEVDYVLENTSFKFDVYDLIDKLFAKMNKTKKKKG